MPSSRPKVVLHLAGLANFAFTIYYDLYHVHIPEDSRGWGGQVFGGHWKYLTFINLWIQLLYCAVCLVADFSSRNSRAVKWRDALFASVAFPIGMFVGIIFWTLWTVDRELVLPERYDPYFPSWLNHCMHTVVLPLQLLEMFLIHHIYPSRSFGGTITAIFCLSYLIWLNVVFYVGGFWVYPVFEVLTVGWRIVFMITCAFMGLGLYVAGEFFNNVIWRKSTKSKRSYS